MKQIYKSIKTKIAAVSALMLLVAATGYAQVKITGTVRDERNAPVSGASVAVPNSSLGTVTSPQGRYTITVPAGATHLAFSLLGYSADTVAINNRTVIDVRMQESAQKIEDLVVIGYGTTRKSDLTGAVSSVKLNDTEVASTTSFDRLIQGRVAGVQVTSSNSAPGGAVEIKVRGTGSWNTSSEPLYVVDGIVMNASNQDNRSVFSIGGDTGGNSDQVAQNTLAAINPSDIVSMEVLKDASATAIYGSQGANGVVLITTRQGTSKKPTITLNYSLQRSQIARKIPLLDTYGFAAWRKEIGGANSIDPDTCGVDWQDYVMQTAWSNVIRMGISGKTDKTNYMLSGSFNDQNGIIQNTGLKVGSLRINLEKTANKIVTFGTKTQFSYQVNNMTLGSDSEGTTARSIIRQMLGTPPYMTAAQDVSNFGGDPDEDISGPAVWLKEYEDVSHTWRVMPSVYIRLNLMKGLIFNSTLGGDYQRKLRTRSYGVDLNQGQDGPGRAGLDVMRSIGYNWDNTLNYTTQLGKHRINAMAGTTFRGGMTEDYQVENNNFPDPKMNWGSWAMFEGQRADDQASNYTETKFTMLSFYARGIYSYNDRYALTATIRADGVSRFAPGQKYGYFPSFAFAWNAANESFLKHVRQINQLKLRLGWGMTGNSLITPYGTLYTYTPTLAAWYANGQIPTGVPGSLGNGTAITGYTADGGVNPSLKWEASEMYNAGIDASAFTNRLNFTVDVYYRRSHDLLTNITVAKSSGSSGLNANRGAVRNIGLEISLDGTPVSSHNFRLTLGGNIAFNRNKILDTYQPVGLWGTNNWAAFLGGNVGSNQFIKHSPNIFITGKPMGLFYGLQTNGIIQAGETGPWDKAASTTVQTSTQPGHVRFVDQNGDGVVDDTDYVIIGNPNPKFTGGFYLSMTFFNNLTLDANFNAVYGNDVLNGNLIQENNVGIDANATQNIRAAAYYQAWRPNAPSNTYPGLGMAPGTANVYDRMVEDGSFLRLSNISLTYNLPLRKKVSWINNVNVSLSARNFWILTNYSGFDPEVSSFAFNAKKIGIDWSSYPNSKALILSIGLTF